MSTFVKISMDSNSPDVNTTSYGTDSNGSDVNPTSTYLISHDVKFYTGMTPPHVVASYNIDGQITTDIKF